MSLAQGKVFVDAVSRIPKTGPHWVERKFAGKDLSPKQQDLFSTKALGRTVPPAGARPI